MARIAIGGWQHETNTFATMRAEYESFAMADEWPPLASGEEMVAVTRDVHLPVAGAIEALQERGHEVVPLLWCSATPCSYVTEGAYERIAADLLDLLGKSLPVDGIYLDLHGAMVCEHLQDGEGELLRRIRGLVGKDMPIYVSLDLHANVTPQMVEHASLLDIYRTYPHVDMGETGYRTATLLSDSLADGRTLNKAHRQIDFLIPLNTGCTLIEPCKSIYDALPGLIHDGAPALAFACGFHLSDIHDVGPAVVGYGRTQDAAESVVDRLVHLIHSNKAVFHEKIWSVDQGIARGRELFGERGGTIVFADTQDNPGGGGAGDTTGLLRGMVEQGLENALVGVINDGDTALKAHEVGIGGRFEAMIGGKTGGAGSQSLVAEVSVVNTSDGRFTATGPMYKGAHMELGPTALLDLSGIQVVVCSKAVQTADQAHFKHLGVDPASKSYVAVKSSVHFRNDYEALSSAILTIASPGEVYADPATLDYKNIRPDIEITSMS